MAGKIKGLVDRVGQWLNLKNLLYNKRFTVPFSVCVSVTLWLMIMINQNPIRDQIFNDITATVSIENTVLSEMGLGIVSDITSQKFSVKLSGPNYIVSSLKPEDIILSADVTDVNAAGTYKLKLVGGRNSSKTGYTFAGITPSEIEVTFDFIDTKEFVVTPKIIGVGAAEGLVAETPVVNGLEGGEITIKGPRTIMEKIDSVVAYAEVNKTLSSTQTYNAEIQVYDEQGYLIDMSQLVIDNKIIKVSVPISKKAKLPVRVAFNNLPAGLAKGGMSYTVDHESVTVIGAPEVVSKMTEVVLSPIDFTTVSKTANQFEVSLALPDGVKLLDNIEFFTVTIDTSGYSEKTLNVTNIKYSGLSDSLSAKISGGIRNVKICGPRADINKIKASDLYAVVDLSDKTAGEYTVSVIIKSNLYPQVWQVGQYNVAVTVK